MICFSVVVRTNRSVQSGLGHLRRCLALAQALRARSGPVTFWGEDAPAVSLVEREAYLARHPGARPAAPRDHGSATARVLTPEEVVELVQSMKLAEVGPE